MYRKPKGGGPVRGGCGRHLKACGKSPVVTSLTRAGGHASFSPGHRSAPGASRKVGHWPPRLGWGAKHAPQFRPRNVPSPAKRGSQPGGEEGGKGRTDPAGWRAQCGPTGRAKPAPSRRRGPSGAPETRERDGSSLEEAEGPRLREGARPGEAGRPAPGERARTRPGRGRAGPPGGGGRRRPRR